MRRIIIKLADRTHLALPDNADNRAVAVTLVEQLMSVDMNCLRGDYSQLYLVEGLPENSLTFSETLNKEEWEWKCKQHEEKLEAEKREVQIAASALKLDPEDDI